MKILTTLCILALSGAVSLHAEDKKKPAGDKPKPSPDAAFKKLDSNSDGSVSKDEFLASPAGKKDAAKAEEKFKKLDKDSDGKLTLEEFTAHAAKK